MWQPITPMCLARGDDSGRLAETIWTVLGASVVTRTHRLAERGLADSEFHTLGSSGQGALAENGTLAKQDTDR